MEKKNLNEKVEKRVLSALTDAPSYEDVLSNDELDAVEGGGLINRSCPNNCDCTLSENEEKTLTQP